MTSLHHILTDGGHVVVVDVVVMDVTIYDTTTTTTTLQRSLRDAVRLRPLPPSPSHVVWS